MLKVGNPPLLGWCETELGQWIPLAPSIPNLSPKLTS